MTTTGSSPLGWVPSSCTLPTTAQPLRLAEFDSFFRDSVHDGQRRGATRLDLTISVESETLARDLANRETACCSFFKFTFTETDGRMVISITVPAAHADVLDALAARVTAHDTVEERHG